jgi:hypothetical protein
MRPTLLLLDKRFLLSLLTPLFALRAAPLTTLFLLQWAQVVQLIFATSAA